MRPVWGVFDSNRPGYRDINDDFPNHFDGAASYIIVSDRMFETQLQPFIACLESLPDREPELRRSLQR